MNPGSGAGAAPLTSLLAAVLGLLILAQPGLAKPPKTGDGTGGVSSRGSETSLEAGRKEVPGSDTGNDAAERGLNPLSGPSSSAASTIRSIVTGPEGAKGLRFVVEKAGRIMAVGPNGKKSTFLDIRGKVSDSGERGLLSVAFAPDYARSRLLYIYFTDNRGDIVIAELKRAANNPRRAKASSLRRVIRSSTV